MGLGFSLLADLLGTAMFFYVPMIYFLEPKKGNRYAAFLTVLAMFMAFETLFRYIFIPPSSALYTVGAQALVFLLICLLYRGNMKKKVLCYLSTMGISFLTEFISVGLFLCIFPDIWEEYISASVENEVLINATRIMGNMVAEVLNMTYALVYLCLVRKRQWKTFLAFLLLPLYQIFLVLGYFMLCSNLDERAVKIGMAMVIFNIVLDVVILLLLEGIFKKLDMQEEMLCLNQQRQVEYEFYQKESQSAEEIRQVRHDFANQLQAAYAMMDDPANAEKVKEMLDEMQKKMS